MLLLHPDRVDALAPVVRERIVRVLEVVGARGRRDGAHRRRQVRQPARVDGEATHHLERTGGVLGADADPAVVPGLDDLLAGDVLDREEPGDATGRGGGDGGPPGRTGGSSAVRLVGTRFRRARRAQRLEGLGGLVVDALGVHLHDLALRVAERRELPAEHAPGVEAHRAVDPLGVDGRRVAVEDHRPAAVVVRPRQPHRQSVLVALTGRVAVQREGADPSGGPALVLLLEAGVRDDQLAVIEHEVPHEGATELADLGAEHVRLGGELRERLGEAVAGLHLPAVERADELVLVVARDGERVTVPHHAHHEPEDARAVRATVDEVAEEHRAASLGVDGVDGPPGVVTEERPAESSEQ